MAVSKVRASPDHEPGTRPAMNFDILIPITLFVCVAYAIKAVVDARVRRQMVESNGSEALVQSILEGEELRRRHGRSEEHTSELQSLMRISYAVFCLKKKNLQQQFIIPQLQSNTNSSTNMNPH